MFSPFAPKKYRYRSNSPQMSPKWHLNMTRLARIYGDYMWYSYCSWMGSHMFSSNLWLRGHLIYHIYIFIWRFPEIGVPPVIIHFRLGFSRSQKPSSYGGTSMTSWKPPYIVDYIYPLFMATACHIQLVKSTIFRWGGVDARPQVCLSSWCSWPGRQPLWPWRTEGHKGS